MKKTGCRAGLQACLRGGPRGPHDIFQTILRVWVGVWLAVCALPAAAADAPPPAAVRTSLDRTAVWIGDPVTYTIEITCQRNVDVLDDDLSKDKLKLDGLDLASVETTRDPGVGDTTIRRFLYHLTSYRVDQPALKIGALSVRYYVKRPGQRLEDAVAAGELQVPGAVIAFRSMLPDNQDGYELRFGRPADARSRWLLLAQPAGIGLVIASIVPVAFWLVAVARSRRTARRSVRRVQREEKGTLEAARSIDVSTAAGRREVYNRIDTLVRHHLRDTFGVAGPSLTPGEVEPALAGRGSRVPVEVVTTLLAACERARYAPADALPSADACRAALDQAGDVLASR